jgi:hypothetical protein
MESELSVLPLSMKNLQHFPFDLQAVLNKLFLWAGSLVSFSYLIRTLLINSDSPTFGASSFVTAFTLYYLDSATFPLI